MVRTARAEGRQFLGPFAIGELKRIRIIREVSDNRTIGGHCAAKRRQDGGGDVLSIGQRFTPNATEQSTLFLLMFSDEFAHLVDGPDAVPVALALRIAPCEQT